MAKNKRRGGWGFAPNLTGPGTVFTLAFVSLAVGMGILLSRGFTPSNVLTEPENKNDPVELVMETPVPGNQKQQGLQLKTLKFKACGSSVTIDFLLDRSGSMRENTPSGQSKMQRLKEAVTEITANADDNSIIGIQSFDSDSIRSDIPISYYRDVKSALPGKIAALQPGSQTPSYRALNFSLSELKNAIPKFPGRNFNFIFISDGQPQPPDEDPRRHNPNPADEIKKLGVTIYSLGIFSANTRDQQLGDLMRSVASSPAHYFEATTADDVKKLLTQISNKICNSGATPSPTQ